MKKLLTFFLAINTVFVYANNQNTKATPTSLKPVKSTVVEVVRQSEQSAISNRYADDTETNTPVVKKEKKQHTPTGKELSRLNKIKEDKKKAHRNKQMKGLKQEILYEEPRAASRPPSNPNNTYNRTEVFSEDFSYPDGSLIGNGSWVNYSGTTLGQVQVSNGTVLLNDTDSEDVRSEFAPITTGMLYLGIDVLLADPGEYTGNDYEYFVGFADTSGWGLFGRADAAAFSATGWSPGISNGTGAAEAT